MTIKLTFQGRVQNDKLLLTDRKRFEEGLRLFNSKEIELTISLENKLRTIPQNKYYWGVVIYLVSAETGNDPNDVHEAFKEMFSPKREVYFNNIKKLVPTSTTELSTSEFNEYIEKIRVWAAEQSIVIPDPDGVIL